MTQSDSQQTTSRLPVQLENAYNHEYKGDASITIVCDYDAAEDIGLKANEDVLRAASPILKALVNKVNSPGSGASSPRRNVSSSALPQRFLSVDDDCGDMELFLRFVDAGAFRRATYSARDLLRISDLYNKYQVRPLFRSSLKRYVDAHAERLVASQSDTDEFLVHGFVVLTTLADHVRSGALWRQLLVLQGTKPTENPPISGYFNPSKLSHEEVRELGPVFPVLVFVENERANAHNHDISSLFISFTKEGEMCFYWSDEPNNIIHI